MSDTTRSIEELAVLTADDAVEPADRVRVDDLMASSEPFRAAVARARTVRGLIASLPRRPMPDAVHRQFLQQLEGERAERRLRGVFGQVPRRSAPADLKDRILAEIRRERAEPTIPVRVARTPSVRRLVPRIAAAAALLLGALLLLEAAPDRPKSSVSMSFAFVREPVVGKPQLVRMERMASLLGVPQ